LSDSPSPSASRLGPFRHIYPFLRIHYHPCCTLGVPSNTHPAFCSLSQHHGRLPSLTIRSLSHPLPTSSGRVLLEIRSASRVYMDALSNRIVGRGRWLMGGEWVIALEFLASFCMLCYMCAVCSYSLFIIFLTFLTFFSILSSSLCNLVFIEILFLSLFF